MSKPVEQLIQSILDDFAASKNAQESLEAKALFRLLNCCLPPKSDASVPDQHAPQYQWFGF